MKQPHPRSGQAGNGSSPPPASRLEDTLNQWIDWWRGAGERESGERVAARRAETELEHYFGSRALAHLKAAGSDERSIVFAADRLFEAFLGEKGGHGADPQALFESPVIAIPNAVRVSWLCLAAALTAGAAAYFHFVLTGSYDMLVAFFSTVGAALFVGMAGAEVLFVHMARRQFDISEPMHTAWTCILLSACCRFTGVVFTQVIAPSFRPGDLSALRDTGIVFNGPLAMAFLAAGLACILRLTIRLQILRSVSKFDGVLICLILLFTANQLRDIRYVLGGGVAWPGAAQALLWFSDPLLAVLLIEVVLVRRTVRNMGHGLIGACWTMMALGVVFTSLGDVFLWATNYGYLPQILVPITWFVWFFPVTAYATAPCFQIEATRRAHLGSYHFLLARG